MVEVEQINCYIFLDKWTHMFHLPWSIKEEEVALLYMSCYSNFVHFVLVESVASVATQVACTASKLIDQHKETFQIYHVTVLLSLSFSPCLCPCVSPVWECCVLLGFYFQLHLYCQVVTPWAWEKGSYFIFHAVQISVLKLESWQFRSVCYRTFMIGALKLDHNPDSNSFPKISIVFKNDPFCWFCRLLVYSSAFPCHFLNWWYRVVI